MGAPRELRDVKALRGNALDLEMMLRTDGRTRVLHVARIGRSF